MAFHTFSCIPGPPGIGKTAIISKIGMILGRAPRRFNLSSSITVGDLIGKYVPRGNSFEWQDGYIIQALFDKKKPWILLDEVCICSFGKWSKTDCSLAMWIL
jgi:midasin (ATPase involved in ribosome maturation)